MTYQYNYFNILMLFDKSVKMDALIKIIASLNFLLSLANKAVEARFESCFISTDCIKLYREFHTLHTTTAYDFFGDRVK